MTGGLRSIRGRNGAAISTCRRSARVLRWYSRSMSKAGCSRSAMCTPARATAKSPDARSSARGPSRSGWPCSPGRRRIMSGARRSTPTNGSARSACPTAPTWLRPWGSAIPIWCAGWNGSSGSPSVMDTCCWTSRVRCAWATRWAACAGSTGVFWKSISIRLDLTTKGETPPWAFWIYRRSLWQGKRSPSTGPQSASRPTAPPTVQPTGSISGRSWVSISAIRVSSRSGFRPFSSARSGRSTWSGISRPRSLWPRWPARSWLSSARTNRWTARTSPTTRRRRRSWLPKSRRWSSARRSGTGPPCRSRMKPRSSAALRRIPRNTIWTYSPCPPGRVYRLSCERGLDNGEYGLSGNWGHP